MLFFIICIIFSLCVLARVIIIDLHNCFSYYYFFTVFLMYFTYLKIILKIYLKKKEKKNDTWTAKLHYLKKTTSTLLKKQFSKNCHFNFLSLFEYL